MPDRLIKYLRSLNPSPDQQSILVYDARYRLWRGSRYLGIATWTKDENVGDSFQTAVWDSKRKLKIQHVYVADFWELVIEKK